jgi:hypothetical protein
VLPIIEVSRVLEEKQLMELNAMMALGSPGPLGPLGSRPFHIVSPWMPNGNIAQYAQMNPGADRLMLVRSHQLEAR